MRVKSPFSHNALFAFIASPCSLSPMARRTRRDTSRGREQRNLRESPLPNRRQPEKYFAASSSIVPLVRIVVEPSRLSMDFEFSLESLMPPLGSQ
jgi:hypothetical protein